MASEALLQQQVCDYLRMQYPNVIFRSDFASGMKLSIGQAIKHKRLQSSRAWPDLFIVEPVEPYGYIGLFIELKAVNIYKKDGSLLKNEHLAEQEACMQQLRERGYAATFAVGFEDAKQVIDTYLQEGKARG